ncbi:MAG: DUF2614 family zinc ribbon-containing protein [Pseudonocardiaceae bacterium]
MTGSSSACGSPGRCPDCNTFTRHLGLGGHCPYCNEPVTVNELRQYLDSTVRLRGRPGGRCQAVRLCGMTR